MGLSLRSSVPDLKLNPITPIFRFDNIKIDSAALSMCSLLLGKTDSSSGSLRSSSLARWTSARISFGRQEPPNANPGDKYAAETFRLLSDLKMSATIFGGMSNALQIVPSSFAKATLSAWNVLQEYLTISAARREVSYNGAGKNS